MATFKHILVPTDFGEAAQCALDVAIMLASKFEAKLTLLHAYEIPVSGYGDGLYWPTDDLARIAQQTLDSALARAKERFPKAEAVLVYGTPWAESLEVAKSRGADLIVVGTHGRRGLSRVLLGSVAEKIVRLSPVPVLTVSGKSDRHAKQTTGAAEHRA